ncbi:MAG: competence/damage-inducible protein A [Syntrophomonadaceae bacterium]|nr:competence/damage-inducible protein A [Syntrophomonadaceae bacterium]
MKKAYIISTGTELILGNTMDTNSVFISQSLGLIGIKVIGISVVGDSQEHLKNAFELGLKSADIVIASGGLGPTRDDLTKEVACEVVGATLKLNEEVANHLQEYFSRRNKEMPNSNLKQAMFPSEAIILDNPIGTAPGMYLKKDDKVIVLLPGPPKEMKKMFNEQVKNRLVEEFNLTHNLSATKTIRVFGPGESQVEEMISDVIENPRGCSIALIAKEGEILVKVTAEGKDIEDSKRILQEIVDEICRKLGKYIYGFDDDELYTIVPTMLIDNNLTLALAESCTGGLLSKYLTDKAGSSKYLWGSVISYSNESKEEILGVANQTLSQYGAVSRETAEEMSRGIKKLSGASLGLAITGIAGPDGGSEEKPVGLVYIALASDTGVFCKEMRFVGDRTGIRTLAAKSGLDMIRRYIQLGRV